MMTTRHMERLFSDSQPRRLYRELMAGRPESAFDLEEALSRPVPLAAMGMLRLDELGQASGTLYRRTMEVVLRAQQPDGGWGDPMTSAICLRALLARGGHGEAVERGLRWLASLQQPSGLWPREPLRRMPEDEFTTAFILMQLGESDRFRQVVRFEQACGCFAAGAVVEPEARRLWGHAAVRCRARLTRPMEIFLAAA